MTAILFDLDRTLVDVQSFTNYRAALLDLEALVGSHRMQSMPATGWSSETVACMTILYQLAGTDLWEEASRLVESHELAAVPVSVPMPGLELVDQVVDRYPTAVVTLLGRSATDAVLELHRVPIRVRVARRADLRPKPAPDQLLEACRLLDAEPTTATMIGDSTWDHQAALAAGMAFIGVTNRGPSEFPPQATTAPDLASAIRRVLS
jgi:phosphoglycolate phosphatase